MRNTLLQLALLWRLVRYIDRCPCFRSRQPAYLRPHDLSGPYIDLAGPGVILAARWRLKFRWKMLGAPIGSSSADHPNKPDVGLSGTQGCDHEEVDAVVDVRLASVASRWQNLSRDNPKGCSSRAARVALSRRLFAFHIKPQNDRMRSRPAPRAGVKSGSNTGTS